MSTTLSEDMRSRSTGKTFLLGALSVAAVTFASPGEARAERKGVLDGVPAVRHRLLLVKKRLEIGLTSEATINSEFRHTLGGGAKLEYHQSDVLSFGAIGIFGKSINTSLTSKLLKGLPETSPATDPVPSKTQFSSHLNSIPVHGALYVGATPWYGKLAAFGSLFVNFDFYFQGGVSFAQLQSKCDTMTVCTDKNPTGGVASDGSVIPADNHPKNDPVLNNGFRPGLYLGGGIHVFVNDWIALDLTVRDYLFSDNPSGLDFNADLAVTDADNRFLNHLFMGIGVSFMLPKDVVRTP